MEKSPLILSRRSCRIVCATALILLCLPCIYLDTRLQALENDCVARSLIPAATTADYLYTLREYEGKIGIFAAGESQPSQLLDVYVFTLPLADQLALQHGIHVYSSADLLSLIEDFTA